MFNPKSLKNNKSLHLSSEQLSTRNKKHSSLSKEVSELQAYMEGISNFLAHFFSKQVSLPALPSLNKLKTLSPVCLDIKQKLKLVKSASLPKKDNLNDSSNELKFKKIRKPELKLNRNQSDPSVQKLSKLKKNIIRPEHSLIENSSTSKILDAENNSNEAQNSRINTNFLFTLSRSLINKVRELRVKKEFYSQFYREFSVIIKENRSHMMKMVHAEYASTSADKLRVAFKAVFAMVCIKNSRKKEVECLDISGIQVNIDSGVRNDPFISDFLNALKVKELSASQATWKAFISDEIKTYGQQINDFTSIIELLVTDNNRHKSRYLGLIEKYQELEIEKNKLLGVVEAMAPYIKQLEDSKSENAMYQSLIEELKTHKDTVKALTVQYNALEKEKTEIQKKYEFLLDNNVIN